MAEGGLVRLRRGRGGARRRRPGVRPRGSIARAGPPTPTAILVDPRTPSPTSSARRSSRTPSTRGSIRSCRRSRGPSLRRRWPRLPSSPAPKPSSTAAGKGNDQLRFELAFKAHYPGVKVIAPLRDRIWCATTKDRVCARQGIPVVQTAASPFSIDENLFGRAIEAGVLEDPWNAPPEEPYALTSDPPPPPSRSRSSSASKWHPGLARR